MARRGTFRAFWRITNFRDLQAPADTAPSRGVLIPRFLTGATSPKEFLDDLRGAARVIPVSIYWWAAARVVLLFQSRHTDAVVVETRRVWRG